MTLQAWKIRILNSMTFRDFPGSARTLYWHATCNAPTFLGSVCAGRTKNFLYDDYDETFSPRILPSDAKLSHI